MTIWDTVDMGICTTKSKWCKQNLYIDVSISFYGPHVTLAKSKESLRVAAVKVHLKHGPKWVEVAFSEISDPSVLPTLPKYRYFNFDFMKPNHVYLHGRSLNHNSLRNNIQSCLHLVQEPPRRAPFVSFQWRPKFSQGKDLKIDRSSFQ